MHDIARYVLNPVKIKQDVVFLDKAAVEEIMRLEPSNRHISFVAHSFFFELDRIVVEGQQRRFPKRPLVGVPSSNFLVFASNHLGVKGHDGLPVSTTFLRHERDKSLPRFGKPQVQPSVVDEVNFKLSVKENAPHQHPLHPLWMSNRIKQRKC